MRVALVAASIAVPALPAAAHARDEWVRVPVANVWAAPGRETIPSDPHAWPTAEVTYSQRLALVGHMPTQVLFGERVLVLARSGAWTKIAVPDQPSPLDRRGYPGWVRTAQLAPAPASTATVTVSARNARLSTGTEISFGTELPVLDRGARSLLVRTPTGPARLPVAAVRPLPPTRADVVRTAKLFLGLRYLWGGLSAWGYDCSGLTWAVYRAHGVTIPRDADAQFAAGRAVPLEDARPGDLVFYGTSHVHHVALYLGRGEMIEAPNSASSVRVAPLRTSDLAGVRRYLA